MWFEARRRRKALAARVPLTDADFCAQVGLPLEQYELASAARRAIARCCNVPAVSIRPDDVFEDIAEDLSFAYWDRLSFILALREETGLVFRRDVLKLPEIRRIKLFGWTIRPGIRVDEWFRDAIPALLSAIG
jgi:hypothetical protein